MIKVNPFTNPIQPNSSGKILLNDDHRAQQTGDVKCMLTRKKTELINIPPGCTSRVQVVEVSVSKPFKDRVRYQFEEHLDKNVTRYMKGDIKVAERRILLTQWVANAWSHVCSKKEMIQRSFKKCGLNNALDGSENGLVNIEGLPEYAMPRIDDDAQIDYALEDDSEDEEDEEISDEGQ